MLILYLLTIPANAQQRPASAELEDLERRLDEASLKMKEMTETIKSLRLQIAQLKEKQKLYL